MDMIMKIYTSQRKSRNYVYIKLVPAYPKEIKMKLNATFKKYFNFSKTIKQIT